MATRLSSLAGLLARGAGRSTQMFAPQAALTLEATPAGRFLGSILGVNGRSFHSSAPAAGADSGEVVGRKEDAATSPEPPRKFRSLVDKELWHEAWMYEDRFGSEDDPIVVPSLESERIIGVTDPEDDNLVVWGILRSAEPPRQFIEGGEFYVLKKVEYVKKVGDVLDEISTAKPSTSIPK